MSKKNMQVRSNYAPITLHHLMSHTGGVSDGSDGVSTLAEVWAMRERLAVGYEAFYDDRPLPRGGLLAPATWLESDSADGSICSTAADIADCLRILLNQGQGPQGRLLSEESFALLTQRVIQPKEDDDSYFYGYGLDVYQVEGRNHIGHDGGMVGYVTTMQANLDDGLGVVVLIQSF